MSGLILRRLEDRYVAQGGFDFRAIPKAAGFRWDPNKKHWWTNSRTIAAKLAEYASGDLKQDLEGSAAVARRALEESRATSAEVEIPCPAGLSYLPFQRAGIAALRSRKTALLADEMGLGKTIQVIGLINLLLSEAMGRFLRVLIVCPASLKRNWRKELLRFLVAALDIRIIDSDTWPASGNVFIINYDILSAHSARLREFTWDLVALDEAHYLKNPKTIRTQQVCGRKAKRGSTEAAISPIPFERAVAVTGTPTPNRVIEAFPVLNYLDPVSWPSYFEFGRRYCAGKRSLFGWDFSGSCNLEELQAKLRSTIMIRRMKRDVLTELPPKFRQVIELPADGLQDIIDAENKAYESRTDALIALRAAVEIAKASESDEEHRLAVERLREGQSASFAEMALLRKRTAEAKLPYVLDHIQDAIETGRKIVVFAHHLNIIDAIVEKFRPVAVKLDGRDTMAARQAAVERFQNDPEVLLFVGGIQAAGVGLTLTASSHVIFAELDWVPANVTQAEDRCHRIGQLSNVLVQHLVLEGSLDAKMAKTNVAKQEVIERVLDHETTYELANADIREVIEQTEAGHVENESESERRTESVSRARIAKEAAELSPEQVSMAHLAMRMLAGQCDGAHSIDGAGFNKLDSYIGHEFARRDSLTPKQAALARRIATKYKRQLGEELIGQLWGMK